MKECLLTSLHEGLYTLTLNRPDKLNCLNWDLLRRLGEAVAKAETDRDVKVVVIRGAGERAFSTGADLNEFRSLTSEETGEWIRLGHRVFNHLESLPKPTLAVIRGYAYGGGLELALACDFRLASDDAQFCSPELQHGWIPGWGGLARLRRLIGESSAKRIIFLSDRIGAQEALHLGLVQWSVAADDLEAALEERVRQLKQVQPATFRVAKSVLNDPLRQTGDSEQVLDVLSTLDAKSRQDLL